MNQLWIQDKVSKGEIEVRKVSGEDNLADALTKLVDQTLLGLHMTGAGQEVREGRHELAPEVSRDQL